MKIELKKITIWNFKGIKSLTTDFTDETTILGINGSGKTSVYDAFLYLMFGKNSHGEKDFELRPLDKDNNPIKGLVLSVEAVIEIDGTGHVFKKEHTEKIIKGALRGYETSCCIDDVPKKVSEYSEYINDIISEDSFKLLTDLHFFNEKLKWPERRKVLLDIAGKIGTPAGFETLLSNLKGRTIEEYKKVLSAQRKALNEEADEINPRIDELQRGLEGYAEITNMAALEKKRTEIKTKIAKLDEKRSELFAQEKERQNLIEYINGKKTRLLEREAELKSDNITVKKLYEEKAQIDEVVTDKERVAKELENEILVKDQQVRSKKSIRDHLTGDLNRIGQEYRKAASAEDDENCYACGQKLPAETIDKARAAKKEQLAKLVKDGNELKKQVDEAQNLISMLEAELKGKKDQLKKATEVLDNLKESRRVSFQIIDKKIATRPEPDFTKDDRWQEIMSDITQGEKELGESLSVQLQKVDDERTELEGRLADANKTFAQADRIKDDKIRIGELETKEKELAQQIADIEKQLNDIDGYKKAESALIESSVNSKFKHTTFKLFEYLINGSIDDTCEAIFEGKPYSAMSCGERIFVGIDIANVLSEHYGISAPLFIDNYESFTMPMEANTQTIELIADRKIKKLIVKNMKKEMVENVN